MLGNNNKEFGSENYLKPLPDEKGKSGTTPLKTKIYDDVGK